MRRFLVSLFGGLVGVLGFQGFEVAKQAATTSPLGPSFTGLGALVLGAILLVVPWIQWPGRKRMRYEPWGKKK